MTPRWLAVPLALLTICAIAASVDATITWKATSTLTTSVHAPLAEFAGGSGALRSPFISNFALTSNHTSFTGTLVGRAGGQVFVRDVVDVVSHDSSSRTVTLRATRITNAQVTEFTWTVRSGASTIATLDARSVTPTATFTLPASATYALDLRAALTPGAGHNNADIALTAGVSVT